MKISTTIQPAAVPLDPQAIKPAGHEAGAATPSPGRADSDAFKVHLTEMARQMSEPVSTEEISHDRVAAIRDQLAAGTYRLSGKDVANKILGTLKG